MDVELACVRDGTDRFFSTLENLGDAEFRGASLLPGWSRSHVVAHVTYNADALARLTESAFTGVEKKMYESADARNEDIERGAELAPGDLRALSRVSAHRLDALWRDAPADAWDREATTPTGRRIPASTVVWMRSREVWLHTVDLNAGFTFADFPSDFIDRLLDEIVDTWTRRRTREEDPRMGAGLVLVPDDREKRWAVSDAEHPTALHGTAADLLQWATGRGTSRLVADGAFDIPAPAPWL